MASPPDGSRPYSPASPSYRQKLLDSMRPTPTSPPPPAPCTLASPGSGSPMSTLDAAWWSPNPVSPPDYLPAGLLPYLTSLIYSPSSPTSPIYSPTSPIYSPTSPRYYCSSWTDDSPPPSSPVYCEVHSPTSPNYCPDEEFNKWASHTSPAPGSPVYCHTQTSPIHGNCSTAANSPTAPGYCPGEFNNHASLALLGSPAYSPTSPGHCPEEFNDVWEDITLADKVQTSASPEYCYCCSTTLLDCCCYQPSDDASAPCSLLCHRKYFKAQSENFDILPHMSSGSLL